MHIEIIVKRTGCKKTEIIGQKDSILELNVKGKPENNEANIEIIKFFSREYKKTARIAKGFKSKRKVIEV